MEFWVNLELLRVTPVVPAERMTVPAVALEEIIADEVAIGAWPASAKTTVGETIIKLAEDVDSFSRDAIYGVSTLVVIFILPMVATSASSIGVFNKLATREPLNVASVAVILALILMVPSPSMPSWQAPMLLSAVH